MNRFWTASLLVVALTSVPVSTFADDIEAAKLAFDNGDIATSNKLYETSAKSGNPEALEHLGFNYLVGSSGFEKNEALGAEYLKKALAGYIKSVVSG